MLQWARDGLGNRRRQYCKGACRDSDMPRVRFHGAVGGVTGSCFELEAAGRRVLLDCGMFQGQPREEARNRENWPFEPAKIDAVVLSHAHLDHSGRLPQLVRDGFSGAIHVHRAGADIAGLLLEDAAWLNEKAAEQASRRAKDPDAPPVAPLYTAADVEACMTRMQRHEYSRRTEILPDISLQLHDAGHILGAAVVEIVTRERGAERRLVYSGDLGHRGGPLMPDWQPIEHADLVLLECTYGNRAHRSRRDTEHEIGTILKAANAGRGNVLVPAFAIGRTQELLYLFARHQADWKLDKWQIFLDSPLGIRATELYARNDHLFRPEAAAWVRQTRFRFPNLRITETTEQSIAVNRIASGAIVIAGSGMCTGGRIIHHLRQQLGRPETQVVFTGFQAAGTPGRALVDGAPEVTIGGDAVTVRASIHTVGGISAHADRDGLCDWVSGFRLAPAIALVHGEDHARDALAQTLRERFQVSALQPGVGDTVDY